MSKLFLLEVLMIWASCIAHEQVFYASNHQDLYAGIASYGLRGIDTRIIIKSGSNLSLADALNFSMPDRREDGEEAFSSGQLTITGSGNDQVILDAAMQTNVTKHSLTGMFKAMVKELDTFLNLEVNSLISSGIARHESTMVSCSLSQGMVRDTLVVTVFRVPDISTHISKRTHKALAYVFRRLRVHWQACCDAGTAHFRLVNTTVLNSCAISLRELDGSTSYSTLGVGFISTGTESISIQQTLDNVVTYGYDMDINSWLWLGLTQSTPFSASE